MKLRVDRSFDGARENGSIDFGENSSHQKPFPKTYLTVFSFGTPNN